MAKKQQLDLFHIWNRSDSHETIMTRNIFHWSPHAPWYMGMFACI